MALRGVAGGVWLIDRDFTIAGVHIGLRTTVLATDDGGVVVISPVRLEAEEIAAIRALGPVRAVMAPNALHHLYLRAAAEAFPEARVLAAEGVAAKQPGLRVDATLGTPAAAALGALGGAIETVTLAGSPKSTETLFFHAPSRTLVATDALFHVVHSEHWWTRTFMRANGAYGRLASSRIFRTTIADRRAFRASLDRALAWNPERLHVAHGDLLEEGAADAVAQAYAWLK
jgi:hypothetical protein